MKRAYKTLLEKEEQEEEVAPLAKRVKQPEKRMKCILDSAYLQFGKEIEREKRQMEHHFEGIKQREDVEHAEEVKVLKQELLQQEQLTHSYAIELQDHSKQMEAMKLEYEKKMADLLLSYSELLKTSWNSPPTSPSPSCPPSSPTLPTFDVSHHIIYHGVVSKIEHAYRAKYEKLVNDMPFNSPSVKWAVHLEGENILLQDATQTLIDDAYTQYWANGDFSYVLHDAYQVSVANGTTYSYTVSHDPLSPTPMQRNTTTGTCRQIVAVSKREPGTAEAMSLFSVSLCTEMGDFLFAEEYSLIQKIKCEDTTLWETTEEGMDLPTLAATFSKPFNEFSFGEESEMWFRPSLFSQFLFAAHDMWKTRCDSSCFVWAHGTANHEQIRADPFGMNQKFSSPLNLLGEGVYVSPNTYVASKYGTSSGRGEGCFVIGIALTHPNDTLVMPYRIPNSVRIPREHPAWKIHSVDNAIFMRNAQLSSALPLGFVVKK